MTALEVLKQASAKAYPLMEETSFAPLPPERYEEALRELAAVFCELPEELEGLWEGIPSGVRSRVRADLSYLAQQAAKFVAEEQWISLSVLLVDRGSKAGDPNRLQKIVARVEAAIGCQ